MRVGPGALCCRSGFPPIPAETGQRYSESFAVDCVVAATGPKLFVDQIEADIGRSYGVSHSTISRLASGREASGLEENASHPATGRVRAVPMANS